MAWQQWERKTFSMQQQKAKKAQKENLIQGKRTCNVVRKKEWQALEKEKPHRVHATHEHYFGRLSSPTSILDSRVSGLSQLKRMDGCSNRENVFKREKNTTRRQTTQPVVWRICNWVQGRTSPRNIVNLNDTQKQSTVGGKCSKSSILIHFLHTIKNGIYINWELCSTYTK